MLSKTVITVRSNFLRKHCHTWNVRSTSHGPLNCTCIFLRFVESFQAHNTRLTLKNAMLNQLQLTAVPSQTGYTPDGLSFVHFFPTIINNGHRLGAYRIQTHREHLGSVGALQKLVPFIFLLVPARQIPNFPEKNWFIVSKRSNTPPLRRHKTL